ncbi:MAG TPA: hypothetical protein VIN11_07520 [Roseivirga sp.]
MDFDFGTILYVILAIIYFIVQNNSKNKKKQQRQSQTPNTSESRPQDRRPTFEELLAEFTGQKQAQLEPEMVLEPVREVKERVPEKTSYEIAQERIDRRNREADAEVANIRARTNKALKKEEPIVELQPEESDYAEMFSNLDAAKKAFIASEVFQRKYH